MLEEQAFTVGGDAPSGAGAIWSDLKRTDIVLWTTGIAVGLLAESRVNAWSEPVQWLPDLAVGIAFVGAGAFARQHRRPVGVMLVVIGFLWFAGNFVGAAVLVHRGVLIHLLLTYPRWRPISRIAQVGVAAAYSTALFTSVWRSNLGSIVLALALIGVVWQQYLLADAVQKGHRRLAWRAAAALSGVLILGALGRIALPDDQISIVALTAYEIVLTGIAISLAAGLRRAAPGPLTDLVIELGEQPSGGLRDALAGALGDPTLEVGYWSNEVHDYTDANGTRIDEPNGARVATNIDRDGSPFAVILHDAAVLQDPGLVAAVSAATRLTASNVGLQAEVQAQVDEVAASRRRLVVAASDEQRRLEAKLRSGPERRLIRIESSLRVSTTNDQKDEHLQRALEHLGLTIDDLRVLARGLHPRELNDGVASALAALAARSPIPTTVSIKVERVPPEIEVAIYFLCAEALANAAKHSGGSRVAIKVWRSTDRISVVVADDGVGGAHRESSAAGLEGITDRIEALGGRLTIDSPSRGGTRLAANIPIGGEPPLPI